MALLLRFSLALFLKAHTGSNLSLFRGFHSASPFFQSAGFLLSCSLGHGNELFQEIQGYRKFCQCVKIRRHTQREKSACSPSKRACHSKTCFPETLRAARAAMASPVSWHMQRWSRTGSHKIGGPMPDQPATAQAPTWNTNEGKTCASVRIQAALIGDEQCNSRQQGSALQQRSTQSTIHPAFAGFSGSISPTRS